MTYIAMRDENLAKIENPAYKCNWENRDKGFATSRDALIFKFLNAENDMHRVCHDPPAQDSSDNWPSLRYEDYGVMTRVCVEDKILYHNNRTEGCPWASMQYRKLELDLNRLGCPGYN